MSNDVSLTFTVNPYLLPPPHSGSTIKCTGATSMNSTLQDIMNQIVELSCNNEFMCGLPLSYTAQYLPNKGNFFKQIQVFALEASASPFHCYPPKSVEDSSKTWNITVNGRHTFQAINDIHVRNGDFVKIDYNAI